MIHMKTNRFLFAAVVLTFLAAGCNTSEDPKPLVSLTVNNLPADPPTGFNPNTGQPTGTTGKFTFFSFETGTTVPNTDSLTNKWDLGFRGTTIIVNGGQNRIGNGGAKVIDGLFDDLTAAPLDGYSLDGANGYAIPAGSGNGWYTYDGATQTIIPTAGKVIVVRTGKGKYAKMEILSYYKNAPSAPTSQTPSRYYTFRYLYQPDGTVKLN